MQLRLHGGFQVPHSPHSQRWLRRRVIAGGSLLAAAGLTAGLLAAELGGGATPSSTSGGQTSTPSGLSAAMAYYRGKTLTLVSPDKPGGGFDQWARLVAPYLASYLHATVNVDNIPAGNTVAGQNFVAHAPTNGLTLGWLNAGPDVENAVLGLSAVNFVPTAQQFLGATAPGQTALLVAKTAACAKWSSLAAIAKGSSASTPVTEVLQTAGTGTFFTVMADVAFGVHYKALTGYASTSDQTQGFVRGDGCLTDMPAAQADSLVKGGAATAILLSTPLQPNAAIAKDFVGVPTVAEESNALASSITTSAQRDALTALNDVDSSTRVLFAPAGTPAGEVTALSNAFKSAMANSALQRQAIAEGNPTGWESNATATQQYESFLDAAKKEAAVLRPIVG